MGRGIGERVRAAAQSRGIEQRELLILAGLIALGLAVRFAFLLATRHHALAGDEPLYADYGNNALDGNWFWAATMGQEPHPTMWKPPGYPLFVMLSYSILGDDPDRTMFLQALLFAPVTIGLVWLFTRDLFGSRAALLAAGIAAVYPGVWQFEVRLFSEGMAAPLALLATFLVLGRGVPSWGRVAAVGVVLALNLYVRPTSVYLFVLVLVAWWVAGGLKLAVTRTAVVTGIAVLMIMPWTIRNATLEDSGFVPLSVQDGAVYGTFNEDAANDPDKPYAWRPFPPSVTPRLKQLYETESEYRVREEVQEIAFEYIKENPESVPLAIFWNGLSRYWDIRRPSHALDETEFQGRERSVAAVHIAMYYVILILVLVGLWRWRRNRAIVLPLVALVPVIALIFSIDSGSRYRAPMEPVLVALAAGAALGASPRLPARAQTT